MTKQAQKSVRLTSIKSAGERAPTFDLPVKIPRTDGSVFAITIQAKALRRSDWAAARDAAKPEVPEAEAEKEIVKETFFTDLTNRVVADGIAPILKGADGWDLEDKFSAESLQELEDVLPGALQTILSALDAALIGGRLGN